MSGRVLLTYKLVDGVRIYQKRLGNNALIGNSSMVAEANPAYSC
jgi:hypothetical protein